MNLQSASQSPASVGDFRARYREDLIPAHYSGWLHAAFTASVSVVIVAWSIAELDAVRPLEWLTIPLTFLYANLAEYWGHRGPMHHPKRGLTLIYERHARQHHRFFTSEAMALEGSRDLKAVLFPPVLITFFVLAFALPVGLVLGWVATPNVAWLFLATALAYFLNYEILHLLYHLPSGSWPTRWPGFQALRRLHWQHHDPRLMAHCNFNITYPVGDWLFGTLHREPRS